MNSWLKKKQRKIRKKSYMQFEEFSLLSDSLSKKSDSPLPTFTYTNTQWTPTSTEKKISLRSCSICRRFDYRIISKQNTYQEYSNSLKHNTLYRLSKSGGVFLVRDRRFRCYALQWWLFVIGLFHKQAQDRFWGRSVKLFSLSYILFGSRKAGNLIYFDIFR